MRKKKQSKHKNVWSGIGASYNVMIFRYVDGL